MLQCIFYVDEMGFRCRVSWYLGFVEWVVVILMSCEERLHEAAVGIFGIKYTPVKGWMRWYV